MKRLVVLAAALLLVAAGGARLFHVPRDQVMVNRIAWEVLSPGERAEMRAMWQRVQSADGSEAERLTERMATLSRLVVKHRRRADAMPTEDELVRQLDRLPERVDRYLDDLGSSPGTPSERVRRRTTRRLDQFLTNLETGGVLEPGERARLLAQPFDQRVRDSLELQKREELFFMAEAHLGGEPDATELEPLSVVDRSREQRRRAGFLGRAAQLLELSPEDRALLADAPDDRLVSILRQAMAPKVRELLEQRGLEPAAIDKILEEPYRQIERTLHRLLEEDGAPAAR